MRSSHALEIAQCDEQSSKLRHALGALEGRLASTEEALKAARDAATRASSQRNQALIEREDGAKLEGELRRMLREANARLASLGQPSVGTPSGGRDADASPSGATPRSSSSSQHHRGGGGGASSSASQLRVSSRGHGAISSRASLGGTRPSSVPSIAGLASAAERARSPATAVEDDLLLSQRAFDFLAELGPSRPNSAPPTPANGSALSPTTPRSSTPASLLSSSEHASMHASQQPSPLSGGAGGFGTIDV